MTEVSVVDKIKHENTRTNLSTTANDVLISDDIAATGPICEMKNRLIIKPVLADKHFKTIGELCSQTTIAAASG